MKAFVTICMVLCLTSVASATTYVLGFDNITTDDWATIPDGYGGFDWSNSEAVIEGYAGYYTEAAVSGDYAFNNDGWTSIVATVLSSGTFDFYGAYFSPADALDHADVIAEGFLGGISQGTVTIQFTGATPVWVDCSSLAGIDELVFTSQGTVGEHDAFWAMDDFASSVPEPATLSLLAFGGVALLRRRR